MNKLIEHFKICFQNEHMENENDKALCWIKENWSTLKDKCFVFIWNDFLDSFSTQYNLGSSGWHKPMEKIKIYEILVDIGFGNEPALYYAERLRQFMDDRDKYPGTGWDHDPNIFSWVAKWSQHHLYTVNSSIDVYKKGIYNYKEENHH